MVIKHIKKHLIKTSDALVKRTTDSIERLRVLSVYALMRSFDADLGQDLSMSISIHQVQIVLCIFSHGIYNVFSYYCC